MFRFCQIISENGAKRHFVERYVRFGSRSYGSLLADPVLLARVDKVAISTMLPYKKYHRLPSLPRVLKG